MSDMIPISVADCSVIHVSHYTSSYCILQFWFIINNVINIWRENTLYFECFGFKLATRKAFNIILFFTVISLVLGYSIWYLYSYSLVILVESGQLHYPKETHVVYIEWMAVPSNVDKRKTYVAAPAAIVSKNVKFNSEIPDKTFPCRTRSNRRRGCSAVKCPIGTYFNVVAEKCMGCDIGTYQPNEAHLTCIVCPEKTSTIGNNSKSINQCKGVFVLRCIPLCFWRR